MPHDLPPDTDPAAERIWSMITYEDTEGLCMVPAGQVAALVRDELLDQAAAPAGPDPDRLRSLAVRLSGAGHAGTLIGLVPWVAARLTPGLFAALCILLRGVCVVDPALGGRAVNHLPVLRRDLPGELDETTRFEYALTLARSRSPHIERELSRIVQAGFADRQYDRIVREVYRRSGR